MSKAADKELRLAAKRGDVGGIRAALEAGARELHTALADAAAGGHVLAATYLLDRGASLRWTGPLADAAAQSGSAEILRLLFQRGLVILDDELAQHCVEAAARAGDPESLGLLLDHCAALEPNLDEALLIAIEEEKIETARLLLDRGADPNAAQELEMIGRWESRREEALWIAIEKGNASLVRLLLERGADPQAREGDILRAAETAGWEEILRLLREASHPTS
jgi:ankyrin repeat protein